MQAAISSGAGSRFSGGRHFTTFSTNTSSRVRPVSPRRRSRSFPAAPTNGRPTASSLAPGASPTKSNSALALPSPGTLRVRDEPRGQARQDSISCASVASAAARPSGTRRASPEQLALNQQLGDLYRIRRSTFTDVIAHDPECESVFNACIHAHAADKDAVATG